MFEEKSAVENSGGLDDKEKLVMDIRDFLFGLGGRASTQAIVDNFKLKIGEDDVAIFRSMLKKIANFDKPKKLWRLKKEFS
jgi:hypothetical protein